VPGRGRPADLYPTASGLTALADRPHGIGITLPHHLHQMAAIAAGGRLQDVAPDAVGESAAVETMADRLLNDVVPASPASPTDFERQARRRWPPGPGTGGCSPPSAGCCRPSR